MQKIVSILFLIIINFALTSCIVMRSPDSWHDNQLRQNDKVISNNLGVIGEIVNPINAFASLIAYIPAYYGTHAGLDAGSFNQQQLHANQNNISKYDANGSATDTSHSSLNLQNLIPIYQPAQPQKINILNPGSFLIN